MGQAFGTTNSHNDEQRHYTRKEIGMSIVLFVIVGLRCRLAGRWYVFIVLVWHILQAYVLDTMYSYCYMSQHSTGKHTLFLLNMSPSYLVCRPPT